MTSVNKKIKSTNAQGAKHRLHSSHIRDPTVLVLLVIIVHCSCVEIL